MAEQAVAAVGPRIHPGWQAARIGLVVLWVAWAATAWWSAPRESTVEQARADLAAGRVAAYAWVDLLTRDGGFFWGSYTLSNSANPTTAPQFAWRTHNGRVAVVPVDGLPTGPGLEAPSDRQLLLRAVAADAAGDGADSYGGVIPRLPTILLATLGVACLSLLVAGPPPVRGTKWYWFWILGIPLGIGLLAWLIRERPWTSPATPPAASRARGHIGFLYLIGSGIAISLVVFAVHWALPDRLEWIIPDV